MTAGARLRWEWTLDNGARLSAELDTVSGYQEIRQGNTLLAQATAHVAKSHEVVAKVEGDDGHNRDAVRATVAFDPSGPFCVLRVGGFEVSPRVWPTRRSSVVVRPDKPIGGYILFAVLVAAVAGVFVYAFIRKDPAPAFDAAYRAPSGLFVAHHPRAMALTKAVVPAPLSGIVLSDQAAHETIVIAAYRLDESPGQDGWTLQQRLGQEILTNIPKEGAYQERERHDDKCLGGPGASTTGVLPSGARVWTCAAVRDGRGYLVAVSLPDPPVDLARLRTIVDATELTNLAPLDR